METANTHSYRMDAWPRREKKKEKETEENKSNHPGALVLSKNPSIRKQYRPINTLSMNPSIQNDGACSSQECDPLVFSSHTPRNITVSTSLNRKSGVGSGISASNPFLESKSVDMKIRRVFHEIASLPDAEEVPARVELVNTAHESQLRSSCLSVPTTIKDETIMVTNKPIASFSNHDNFVRSNLKRKMIAKPHIKRAHYGEKGTFDEVKKEKPVYDYGSGMLEEEVIDAVLSMDLGNEIEASQSTPNTIDAVSSRSVTLPIMDKDEPTRRMTENNACEAPLCNHGIPAVLRRVKRAGKNHNREFYCCCHDRSTSCGYFLWKENNLDDVVHMIKSTIQETGQNQDSYQKGYIFQLVRMWKEEYEQWTIEELKHTMRMNGCSGSKTKKGAIQCILDRIEEQYEAIQSIKMKGTIEEEDLQRIGSLMFNVDSLRPGQREVIQSVRHHVDTLFVSPTGSGKSLTYQIPSLLHDGITLVVSPLVSLMQDQHKQLPPLLPSLVLSGVLDPKSILHIIHTISVGLVKVLFISPEKLFSSFFKRLLVEAKLASRLRLLVVDEAHCISSWSFNFRADYMRLYSVISVIRNESKEKCSVLCLTATGGEEIISDICSCLHINRTNVIDNGWKRKEIRMASVLSDSLVENQKLLLSFLRSSYFKQDTKRQQNVIVFVPFRRDTDVLCEYLQSYKLDCSVYHGGLDMQQRKKSIRSFNKTDKKDSLHVIVATSAFGLGVNLKNIRSIVHMYGVRSIQEYLQEIGRYRNQDENQALCMSYLNDGCFMKLYSQSYGNYLDERKIRHFIKSIVLTKVGNFNSISYKQMESRYDMFESSIQTILVLLENHQIIRIHGSFNNHYRITPFAYQQLLLQSPFFASVFNYSNNYDVNSNTFEFDLFSLSLHLQQPLFQVKEQIRQLEIRHQIVVKADENCCYLEVIQSVEDSVMAAIVNSILVKQENEVEELKRIYYILNRIRVDKKDVDELINGKKEEDTKGAMNPLINLYFKNKKNLIIDIDEQNQMHLHPNEYLKGEDSRESILWPVRHVSKEIEGNVIRSVKRFLRDDRIVHNLLTGMTFAKIWHSVASPLYSYEIWSCSEQWGLYEQYDIQELAAIAQKTIESVEY